MNITNNLPIFFFIPYNTVIKQFLPNGIPKSFGYDSLELLHNPMHCRGEHCSSVHVITDNQYDVNMIWHDDIRVYCNHWIVQGNVVNHGINDGADGC